VRASKHRWPEVALYGLLLLGLLGARVWRRQPRQGLRPAASAPQPPASS